MLNADDAIRLATDAFSASTNWFNASIRAQIEADMRQFQGVHPAGSKYTSDAYKGRSKLFRPKTRSAIRKNEAVAAEAFFSTNDVVNIKPDDDSDEVSKLAADILNPIMQKRLTRDINWFLTCIGAYQESQSVGVVTSYQNWEFNEKRKTDRPFVKLVPVENIRISPASDWTDPIGTSPYVIELIPMYVGDVKANMRTADPKTKAPKWKDYTDGEITAASKAYADPTRLLREGQRTDSKDQGEAVTDFSIVWVHRNIVRYLDDDYVYYTLGHEKLLTDPKPIEQVYPHLKGGRPYVMGFCALEAHKIYPGGVSRIGKDVQMEINDVTNQRLDNVRFVMNKRYFAARNRQVDTRSLTRNVPGSVTFMQDPEKDVRVVDTPDVTGSAYQEQDRLNLDFDDVAGSFSQASVQSNRKLNETVGGMNILTTNANQVSGYQLRTQVETWVEPVMNQVLALEIYYESDPKMIGLSPEGRAFLKQGGDIEALFDTDLHIKVNVGMGATNPHDQVQNFMTGLNALRDALEDGTLQKLGLQPREVIKEVFGKLGYSDGSRFFKQAEDMDPMVADLQKQVQELQAALEAKQPQALVDAQVKKIIAEIDQIKASTGKADAEKVNKNVATTYAAVQAAEVIAAIPSTAPVADEIMRSAGYVSPPGGMDPNLPQPAQADPSVLLQQVNDKKTGTGFMPGGQSTDPMNPAQPEQPASPNVGAGQGIETLRQDGAQ